MVSKILHLRHFVFILLAVSLPISIAAANVTWVMALFLSALLWILDPKYRSFKLTGIEKPWAIFMLISIVSALVSNHPHSALRSLFSHFLITILIVLSWQTSSKQIKIYLVCFCSAVVFAGFWGVFQKTFGLDWNSYLDVYFFQGKTVEWPHSLPSRLSLWYGRARGFVNHPITYAEVLLPIFFILIGWGIKVQSRRYWLFLGAGLIGLGILFSQTRGVWLALGSSLFLWGIVKKRLFIWGLIGGLCLVAVSALFLSPQLRARTQGIYNVQSDSSGLIRLGLWRRSLVLTRDNPILGVGPGQILIRPNELHWGGSAPDRLWTESHNIFLQISTERGLLGLMAFLFFLFSMARVFWRLPGPIGEGFFFGFLGLVFAGMTESWSHDSEVMMALYFLLACASVWARDAYLSSPSLSKTSSSSS